MPAPTKINKEKYNQTLETFKSLDDFKICCKVSIIECINSVHVARLTKCMKSCLEAIEAVDLCQFIKKLDSPIEILKIDVEGVEYGIVNKLIDTELIYDIKNVFVEVHAKKFQS